MAYVFTIRALCGEFLLSNRFAPPTHVGGGRTCSGYRKVFPAELLVFCSDITLVGRAQPTKTFLHPAHIHPPPCGLVGVLRFNVIVRWMPKATHCNVVLRRNCTKRHAGLLATCPKSASLVQDARSDRRLLPLLLGLELVHALLHVLLKRFDSMQSTRRDVPQI
jgi:hypothetical protein